MDTGDTRSTVHWVSYAERTQCASSMSQSEGSQPYFAVYDDAFASILGSEPSIQLALDDESPLWHEAGVYVPQDDAFYITSNRFVPKNRSEQTILLGRLTRPNGNWKYEVLDTDVVMGNGGINYKGGIVFCDQGSKTRPGGLVQMDPKPPYQTKPLIDGFHGRLFNSVNDVVVHSDGSLWFTDPIYGFEQKFKEKPALPCQVYRFSESTGDIRVVADGFNRPNGLCFSPDEQTMYITDTDYIHGDGTTDLSRVSTIYAFDVVSRHGSHFLANRRVFAMASSGAPDGIKCDVDGNVYSGCGDGVNVWSPGGTLIGKIIIPGGVANFCFARKGELLLLNETRVWIVKIDKKVQGALLKNMGIEVE